LAIGEFALPAAAHEQDAIRERTGHAVQEQRLPHHALDVAAAQDVGDVAAGGVVERLRGGGELARLHDAGNDATRTLLLRIPALDPEFHIILSACTALVGRQGAAVSAGWPARPESRTGCAIRGARSVAQVYSFAFLNAKRRTRHAHDPGALHPA